ncbi:Crp/Fnr family transcriptional regulator [Planctomycetaceae bacterium SH139]
MDLDSPQIRLNAALRRLPVLVDCCEDDLEALAEVGELKSFPRGTVLFSEGEQHEQLYFLCDGSIQLDMETTGHGRRSILSVGAGDLLAWSALVGEAVMTTTATVTEPVEAVVFAGPTLTTLLESNPKLGYHFMRSVSKMLSRRLLATRLQLLDLYRR